MTYYKLPTGWTMTTLKDFGGLVGGKTPSKAIAEYWAAGTVPWVSPKDMKSFLVSGSEDKITLHALSDSSMNLLPEGSVLMVTRSGILAHTFPVAITGCPVTINQDIKAVKPGPAFQSRWLAYVLRAQSATILSKCTKSGTTVASVEMAALESLPLPLPPLAEQTRIADKLDAVLSRVDDVNARLDRVAPLLKRFRQSVLAAATSGRLTEDWREQDSAQWQSVQLGELMDSKPRNGYSPKAVDHETGVRSLTLSATTSGKFLGQHAKFIDEKISTDSHLWLESGDILIQRANSLEYVGVSAIFDGAPRTFIYPDLMMKCRANSRTNTRFLHIVLSSEPVRKYFRDNATGTAGNMPKINQQTVISAPCDLPPLDEQTEIVRRVEILFAFADRLEARLKAARTAAQRLTPAVLAKAFRGELVAQDPADEPAAELLQRLAAQRPQAPVGAQRSRSGARS